MSHTHSFFWSGGHKYCIHCFCTPQEAEYEKIMTKYNTNEGFGRTLKETLDRFGPKCILDEATCFLRHYHDRFFHERNAKMVEFALELVKDHPELDKEEYERVRQHLEEARKVLPPQEPPKSAANMAIDVESINEWLTLNELIKLLERLITKIDGVADKDEGHPFVAHNREFLHDAQILKSHFKHMLPLIQTLDAPDEDFKKALEETWRKYNEA